MSFHTRGDNATAGSREARTVSLIHDPLFDQGDIWGNCCYAAPGRDLWLLDGEGRAAWSVERGWGARMH